MKIVADSLVILLFLVLCISYANGDEKSLRGTGGGGSGSNGLGGGGNLGGGVGPSGSGLHIEGGLGGGLGSIVNGGVGGGGSLGVNGGGVGGGGGFGGGLKILGGGVEIGGGLGGGVAIGPKGITIDPIRGSIEIGPGAATSGNGGGGVAAMGGAWLRRWEVLVTGAEAWEGISVVISARKLIGATNPLNAEPGTTRGDLAVQTGSSGISDYCA
nr:hypothetical protein Iba_chr10fCG7820 [Ipomoea batatas]